MSRAVPMIHEFDKERFAELLKQAKGSRTQIQFAQDCGLSVSHLNRYFNLNKERPPVPSSIIRIAQNAENGVTLEDLLTAAGYDPNNNYAERPGLRVVHDRRINENACLSAIVKSVSHCAFRWTIPPFYSSDTCNFKIDIEDCDLLEHWFFIVHYTPRSVEDPSGVVRLYGEICCKKIPPKTKISIITWSDGVFERVLYFSPFMLCSYVSIVLFDLDSDKILKEKYLQTALEIPDELLNDFTLVGKS